MADRQEEGRGGQYLRRDLPEEDYDRLVRELRADPDLLRDLLRQTSREDEADSASLLFGETGAPEQDELDRKLRQYLLRDPALSARDADMLEELLVEDERYLDRLSLAENELVEDYLRGALGVEEAARFDSDFLTTPERREKVKYLRALAASARAVAPAASRDETTQPAPATETSSLWRSLIGFLRVPDALLAGAAVFAVLLLLGLALVLLLNRPPEGRSPLQAEAPAKTQNSSPSPMAGQRSPDTSGETPSTTPITKPTPDPPPKSRPPAESPRPLRAVPPQPRTVFALISGVLRGEAAGAAGKRIEAGSKLVELRLRLDLERAYRDYRVVVENSEGKEVARRGRLRATTEDGLQTVVVTLPAARFGPDDYTVTLSGRAKGGYAEVDRYSFRVLR